ncbi:group II intron maturase-specific domain-containing protein [Streptomyces sp. YIM S03343]
MGSARHLAQWLVARGESVVDVPASATSRVRQLARGGGRKNDRIDAAAAATAHIHGDEREVDADDHTTALPLEVLLHRLNPVLRGWCLYFQPGVSSATFRFLRAFTWRRVIGWLRRKRPRANWKQLRRRYCQSQWWPKNGETALFGPGRFGTTRYRYRGAAIPTPWASRA